MKTKTNLQNDHPFVKSPHKTLLSMSLPVLLSLVAEPLTGLVDTAFVARLGAEALAALGVGTVTLSGIFWVFNFLGIGTQTEVAQAYGRQEFNVSKEVGGSALALAALIGLLLVVFGLPFVPYVSTVMGAIGAVFDSVIAIYLHSTIWSAGCFDNHSRLWHFQGNAGYAYPFLGGDQYQCAEHYTGSIADFRVWTVSAPGRFRCRAGQYYQSVDRCRLSGMDRP